MTEQLALDQFLGNRGTVDLDELRLGPPRQRMNTARDQLLAGAVLAKDEHAAVARRRAIHLLSQRDDPLAFADDFHLLAELRAQARVLLYQRVLAERVAHHQQQALERNGLLDEVVRPQLRGAHGSLDIRVPGDHHGRFSGVQMLELLEDLEPIHPRQPDVEQHQIVALTLEHGEGQLTAARNLNGVALVTQGGGERGAYVGLVVNDQDAGCHRRSVSLSRLGSRAAR